MRSAHRPLSSPRRGLTLVELLVVIGIVAGLAALTVLIFPSLQDSQRAAKGADVVQGQLFIAKQMALRDQLPRGVRLVASGAASPGTFDQLQLIEQPAPYTAGVVIGVTPPAAAGGTSTVTFGPDPTTGAAPDFSNVQAGDLLDLTLAGDTYSIPGAVATPAMHLITQVSAATATLTVLTTPQVLTNPTGLPYRIIRSPRPLIGEAVVNMPNGIIVNKPFPNGVNGVNTGSLMAPDTFSGQFDILFDTSGKVLRSAGTQGKVVLWVCADPAANNGNPYVTDQTLIAVYTRTGGIVAQPVNVNPNVGSPPGDPYAFVKDGVTSGM